MKLIYTILWLLTLSNLPFSKSYRILGIFPLHVKSHNLMFNALVKGLAKHGHQIDVITHFPLKHAPPNYKVIIDLNGTIPSIVNSFTMSFVRKMSAESTKTLAQNLGNSICDLMKLEEMQKLIKNPPTNPPYDLVITEAFAAHCYMGFGHLLKVPVVAVSSAIEYPWINSFIGNNDNPSYVPCPDISVFERLNFWQRLQNIYFYYTERYTFDSMTENIQTEAMRKYLSPDMPNVRDVEKNVALLLVNSHSVIFGIKPVTPALVQVGGLHIEADGEGTKLTPELKKWLDESTNGVVYFSFGSMVLIETLPVDTINAIYKAFSNIAPVRVLMKIADEKKLPPGLPSNVLISPWIPQQAVLSHHNTKIFVTHGGLMGCQEALYYGIPMIGIPLFSDQPRNVAAFVSKNMAIKLDLDELTAESLSNALRTILTNPIFRENAKYYSKLFKDRPMSAMDTAIFWIEYVIRNGPNVLKSPALDLQWWQLILLDIFGFILLNLILVIALVYYIIKCSLKMSKCSSTKIKQQ